MLPAETTTRFIIAYASTAFGEAETIEPGDHEVRVRTRLPIHTQAGAISLRLSEASECVLDSGEAIQPISAFDGGTMTVLPATRPRFVRGDCNGDGRVRGSVTDAIHPLQWSFLGGAEPPAPFPECGFDPVDSPEATCERSSAGCSE